MRYTAWPLWRNNRWELEVFEEEGSTVIERLPLKELLNRPEVARVLDRLVAEANLLVRQLPPSGSSHAPFHDARCTSVDDPQLVLCRSNAATGKS